MKTILITGGTNGIGKCIALYYLSIGWKVIVIGNSVDNGDIFYNTAKQLGALKRAIYIQANLSLICENKRVINELKTKISSLDVLVFCASKHNKSYSETQEGYELTFALYYLSRFILSYGLKELLEKSLHPVILNVCAPGMKGKINWDDLQHRKNYKTHKVSFHGSRLNDLLGVYFVESDNIGKIKYILFNPMAVQTDGVMNLYQNPIMKLILKLMYKFIAKPVEKAIKPIVSLLENNPISSFSAFKENKPIKLNLETFNNNSAKRLFYVTNKMLLDN